MKTIHKTSKCFRIQDNSKASAIDTAKRALNMAQLNDSTVSLELSNGASMLVYTADTLPRLVIEITKQRLLAKVAQLRQSIA